MKLYKLLCLTSIVLFFGFIASSPIDRFVSLLEEMKEKFSPEKTYIHTDKPFYTSGETIWLKGYLVDGISHKPTNKSNVLYIELINTKDSIVFKDKFYVKENTFGAAGDIKVSDKWDSGNYQIRAYTNYMRNEDANYFFKKNISILKSEAPTAALDFVDLNKSPIIETTTNEVSPLDKNIQISGLSINFYPESGTIIPKNTNTFGVKALDNTGKGVFVTGAIKEKGNESIIVLFRTFDFGLGKFSFKPEANKQYIAEVIINGKKQIFELPIAPERAVNLSITNNNDHLILTAANAGKGTNLLNYFIIGHIRGESFYTKIINKKTDHFSVKLITKDLASGVAHFTLFDPSGKPECERLLFIDNIEDHTQTSISLNKKEIHKRERINLGIQSLNAKKESLNGTISLAITQKNVIPQATNETIESWLLLNSELRGEIPNTAVFFDKNKTAHSRKHLLESLMLTHGWRRFNWKTLLSDSYKKKNTFEPEKGIIISGRTAPLKQEYENQFSETSIVFLEGNVFSEKKFTDPNGKFSYGPYVIADTLKTIIQARIPDLKDEKAKEVSIFLDPDLPSPKTLPVPASQTDIESLFVENYRKVQSYIAQLDFTFDGTNQLNEVLIEATAKKDPFQEVADDLGSYGFPSDRIIIDESGGESSLSIFDLLQRIAGVQITGAVPNQSVRIRGGGTSSFSSASSNDPTANTDSFDPSLSNNPLFLIDGAIVDISFIQTLQGSDISFIDVLKGVDAGSFGTQGANGVVAIYTNLTSSLEVTERAPGIINFLTSPFYKSKDFFAPDYSKDITDSKPDYRTTLHWNPNINLTEDKIQNEFFYTSDQTGVYQIQIEGLTNDGKIIYATQEFEVVD